MTYSKTVLRVAAPTLLTLAAINASAAFAQLQTNVSAPANPSQVINGVAVPPLLVFMLLLVNNKGLMGEYVNTRLFNVIAWSTTIVMTVLNLVWFWMFGTGRG